VNSRRCVTAHERCYTGLAGPASIWHNELGALIWPNGIRPSNPTATDAGLPSLRALGKLPCPGH
jgi:hypothetical protein